MTTSQAVDLVGGGVKVNALPETSFFVVNHRVAVDSTLQVRFVLLSVRRLILTTPSPQQAVKDNIAAQMKQVAKRHSLDVEMFGEQYSFRTEDKSGGLLEVVVIQ